MAAMSQAAGSSPCLRRPAEPLLPERVDARLHAGGQGLLGAVPEASSNGSGAAQTSACSSASNTRSIPGRRPMPGRTSSGACACRSAMARARASQSSRFMPGAPFQWVEQSANRSPWTPPQSVLVMFRSAERRRRASWTWSRSGRRPGWTAGRCWTSATTRPVRLCTRVAAAKRPVLGAERGRGPARPAAWPGDDRGRHRLWPWPPVPARRPHRRRGMGRAPARDGATVRRQRGAARRPCRGEVAGKANCGPQTGHRAAASE